MTKPREWPNSAKEARDRSAEEAIRALKAIIASQCGDRPQFQMVRPEDGRIASICLTEEGWGVYITEANGNNVTSFLKNKLRTVNEVIRYMQNRGYELVQ